MPKCCIIGCKEKKTIGDPDFTFQLLPKDITLRKEWIEIIGKDNMLDEAGKTYICSIHLKSYNFIKDTERNTPYIITVSNKNPVTNKSRPSTSKNSPQKRLLLQEDVAISISEERIPMRHVIDIAPTRVKKNPNLSAVKKRLEETCTRQQKRIKWLQEKLHAGRKEMAALKEQLAKEQKEREEDNIVIMVLNEKEG